MHFNVNAILDGLQTGLLAAQQISAAATALGAPTGLITTATGIASAVLEGARNVKDRVDEGHIVLAPGTSQERLKEILTGIQKVNDDLAAYIEAH